MRSLPKTMAAFALLSVVLSAKSANSSGKSNFPLFFPRRLVVPAQMEQSDVASFIELKNLALSKILPA